MCREAVLRVTISFSGTNFVILFLSSKVQCFCTDMLIYTCDVGMPLGGVDKGEIAHTLARHITTVAAMLDVSWTEAFVVPRQVQL